MSRQQQSDEILLIGRIRQREQAALGELYDRYARVMYSLAFKILGSVEEAEEVVLDVFSQAWKNADCYDATRSRVDAWLFLMTRSRALDRLRKRQRQSKVVEVATATAKTVTSQTLKTPEEDLLISERREMITAAMVKLPQEQRQVIELAYFQGLSQAAIAQRTGMKLGTVKTRIRLGLSKLRGLLEEAGGMQQTRRRRDKGVHFLDNG
ncbi:MAG: sigma-70 family RNA polymerase sigma factor [Symploca sp. SIO1A3]|nr:sigma-70 family RNA polymerase sigma factor [Symploca sp. SIO2C1]NER49960.1 sigma-70 family RNA polymerase sigma factor [Symploca sp. SIO1A3]